MKYVAGVAFSVAFAFVLSVPSFAQEFSADVISRTADGKVSRSKLYQTSDKERFDSIVQLEAGKAIETHMTIDRRSKLIYLIERSRKLSSSIMSFNWQATQQPAVPPAPTRAGS